MHEQRVAHPRRGPGGLHADEAAGAAHLDVVDVGEPVAHALEHGLGARHEPVAVDDAGDRLDHRAGHRAAAERGAELAVAGPGADGGGDHHRAHREPTAERLRERDHVGPHAEPLVREPAPEPAHAALDLVEQQQRAHLAAAALDRLEPGRIGQVHAAEARHALDQDAGDGVVDRVERAGVVEVDEPRVLRHRGNAEALAVAAEAGDAERAQRAAVEAVGQRDDPRAPRHAARDVQRRLVGLGPAVDEVHVREVLRPAQHGARGALLHVHHDRVREEVERAVRLGERRRELGVAVPKRS